MQLFVTIDEFARWHREILARVARDGIAYTITDHGEPIADLVPHRSTPATTTSGPHPHGG